MSTEWANCLKIKEAYGFAMTDTVRKAWRAALGFSEEYEFKDTNGVFPIEDMPNERRSLYTDCHICFIDEYLEKHGTELVYDRELAYKQYPTVIRRH